MFTTNRFSFREVVNEQNSVSILTLPGLLASLDAANRVLSILQIADLTLEGSTLADSIIDNTSIFNFSCRKVVALLSSIVQVKHLKT